jgi:adenine-specific DNA-methyltransferase
LRGRFLYFVDMVLPETSEYKYRKLFHAFFYALFSRMEIKEILENTLRKEPNLLSDKGEIKKWVVINKAQNYDETLLGLLLDEPRLKTLFFKEIKKAWVFNLNLFTDFIEQKEFLPDSYTGFPNKIGLHIGGKFLRQRNEVSLVWPYKDCVLEGGQSREEDTRKEIFFNELLAQDEITQLFEPKVITNVQYFGDEKELTPTSNLLIKGNNLLALHSLKKRFTGKVKLIYIDPPYNTGNDGFRYNDSFNHSSWLTFMKNRLEVAKTLLREDGSIWINLDDKEVHYAKILCDEIFNRENFVADVIWQSRKSVSNDTFISLSTNHILLYFKNIKVLKKEDFRVEVDITKFNLDDKDGRGKYKADPFDAPNIRPNLTYEILNPNTNIGHLPPKGRCWRTGKEEFEKLLLDNRIIFGKSGNSKPQLKKYLEEELSKGSVPTTLWSDIDTTTNATKELEKLFNDKVFSNPKPETLIERIVQLSTQESDIVLDYHIGSGTTAAVAHKMKRQYIGIEQMDYIQTVTAERLKKVIDGEQGGISKAVNWQGGGSFIYLELKKYNEHFIEKIRDAQSTEELLEIWEDMKKVSFLNYNIDIKDQEKAIEELKTHSLEVQKQKLASILDKNQLYVSLSNMDEAQYEVTQEEKEFTKAFYQND